MKNISLLILMVFVLCVGCGKSGGEKLSENEKTNDREERQQISYRDCEKIAEGCRDIYEKAAKEDALDTLETKEKFIQYLGDMGFAAVDSENQIDMVHYEQVEEFCRKAQEKQHAETEIFSVLGEGGFTRYGLNAEDGEMDVTVCSIRWRDGVPQGEYYHEFSAYTWKYTDGGYLFIEEYRPSGFDGAPGQTGFRVKPLDETCRELNRNYVIPIGYERNNMLIADWNEQDYANLEFYDLYEIMYRLRYGCGVPYTSDGECIEFEVPKAEMEEVIQTYFQIEGEEIQENMVYDAAKQTYRYRPRTLYDAEFPYEPYPEVVAYEKQEDGTIKLTVNAVWKRELSDCACSSELVIRTLENGTYQYVSNRVIHAENTMEPLWYMPRLTDEQWTRYYEEQ